MFLKVPPDAYVAVGDVATLEHEVGDDAVELGADVAKALLAGAQGAEVLSRLGNDLIEKFKVDAPGLGWWCVHGQRGLKPCMLGWVGNSPLTAPLLVTLPCRSTSISGPVQVTSK